VGAHAADELRDDHDIEPALRERWRSQGCDLDVDQHPLARGYALDRLGRGVVSDQDRGLPAEPDHRRQTRDEPGVAVPDLQHLVAELEADRRDP